jgi:hypothetical protein
MILMRKNLGSSCVGLFFESILETAKTLRTPSYPPTYQSLKMSCYGSLWQKVYVRNSPVLMLKAKDSDSQKLLLIKPILFARACDEVRLQRE